MWPNHNFKKVGFIKNKEKERKIKFLEAKENGEEFVFFDFFWTDDTSVAATKRFLEGEDDEDDDDSTTGSFGNTSDRDILDCCVLRNKSEILWTKSNNQIIM